MTKNLFREKSLKRISSPEELDGYIRVSTPSTWLILSAIIILLASFCIWGAFGRLETIVTASGTVKNGKMTVALSEKNSERVQSDMKVYLNGEAVGTVEKVTPDTEQGVTARISTTNLADGKYELDIIVESINPIYFILN